MTWPQPRVVVTGMGVLAANGVGVDAFWDTVSRGVSGIGPITLFDASAFKVHVAGEVKDFHLLQYLNGGIKPKRYGRHTQFSLVAAKMAVEQAGLELEAFDRKRPLPVAMGVSTSAMEVIESNEDRLRDRGPESVSPYGVSSCQPHATALAVAELLGRSAQPITASSACPAGLDALAIGFELIRSGKHDVVVAGGADAPVTPLAMASFSLAGLAPDFEIPPSRCSRPFDLHRRGGIIAEGAVVMVLENLAHALARGAEPLVEILGYAANGDDAGTESGAGLYDTMALAMANAGLRHDDIDYISAHGPSHPVIDRVETREIKRLFGTKARTIPVSSIKGVVGNPLAAAGPMQVMATALGMRHGLVPPTANYEVPDPACDLDYVPNQGYAVSFDTALVNVHGLGGGNTTMALAKVVSA